MFMEIKLNLNKTIEQNAQIYFEKAKKLKKKIPGIKNTIEIQKEKLIKAEKALETHESEKEKSDADKKIKSNTKKEWFEKFRWVYSSDNFFIVGGRDATTNEIIIKKYTEKNDIVFHTETPGSPFVIIKNPENKKIPETTINEAAELCASFSKLWKSGRSVGEVYYIHPEQLNKKVSLQKGSFIVEGKRTFLTPTLNVAITNYKGKIMSGPVSAIKHHALKNKSDFIELIQGNDKPSDVGKKIQRIIGGDLDEIIRALPPECAIKKR